MRKIQGFYHGFHAASLTEEKSGIRYGCAIVAPCCNVRTPCAKHRKRGAKPLVPVITDDGNAVRFTEPGKEHTCFSKLPGEPIGSQNLVSCAQYYEQGVKSWGSMPKLCYCHKRLHCTICYPRENNA